MPAATTTYTVVGTDAFGCSNSAQTSITVLPLPAVYAGNDIYNCRGNSANLLATGAVTYVWSPATGLSCTTCDNPVATPAATTAYVVTGTGTNGCTNTDTVTVGIYSQPPVNAGPDQTICSGQSAQLQASGALNYIWTPGTDLSCTTCGNPIASPSASITYQVAGTDGNGCRDSDMVTVTVIQRQAVSVDSGTDFCVGGSVQLHAYGGDSYLWVPASSLSCDKCPDPIASPATTTTYTVYVHQGQCFTDTLQTTITIHPLPTVDAGPDQNIIAGNTAQIHATGTDIVSYSWTPTDWLSCTDCPDPVSVPLNDITYTVNVVSPFGCTAADSLHIRVRCDGTQLWMPNTFTPNADGENDFFYPHGKGITQVTRFRIYDRWGELLYDRTNMPVNDRTYGWNGTYKSQVLKPDVYVYIIDATCTNGEPLQIKGDISLIR
jgi:gliding motility-associated-like protein